MFTLSMGVPLGLVIAIIGLVVLVFRRKRLAAWLIGAGLLLSAATIVMIILAASAMP